MQAKVIRWGNSLALRLPKSITEEAGVVEGRIVVVPASRGRFRLDDLLRGITRANRHAEVPSGKPRGREEW
jgi:antitoxin MazE